MKFEPLIQALCDNGVEFVLIGGLAANLHGSAMITNDIDVCYLRTSANLLRITTALAPFSPRPRGFPQELPFVWDASMLRNMTVSTLTTTSGPIDLLAEVAGVGSYEDALADAAEIEAFDRTFLMLDIPALIRSKQAAGRPKDIQAVFELESILEARAD